MPLSRRVAAFNRRVTNRITGPFAGRLPGFGVIHHTGRTSGRRYHTPVNVFDVPDGYVVPLTYGPDAEWVKNVVAAGGAELERRGRRLPVRAGPVFHDEQRSEVPAAVRPVLRGVGVADFLRLLPEPGPPPAADGPPDPTD